MNYKKLYIEQEEKIQSLLLKETLELIELYKGYINLRKTKRDAR